MIMPYTILWLERFVKGLGDRYIIHRFTFYTRNTPNTQARVGRILAIRDLLLIDRFVLKKCTIFKIF